MTGHSHHHHDHEGRNIGTAFFLNLAFTIIEIIGGIYTNSLAILSDALHDLGDSLGLGLSWYFHKLSKKSRDDTFSYGYRRFSLLGAIINAVILLTGSTFILIKAVPGLFHPEQPDTEGMLYLAILGVLVNGAAALKLRNSQSLNSKGVYLHLLEDVFGWVAVLVGSLIMKYTGAAFIDPFLSILISLFIIYSVVKNLGQALRVLLQGAPHDVNLELIRKKISNIEQISDIHDCHIWSMDGSYNVLTVHLQTDKDYTLSQQGLIKERVRHVLHDHPIHHTTIELEYGEGTCSHQLIEEGAHNHRH